MKNNWRGVLSGRLASVYPLLKLIHPISCHFSAALMSRVFGSKTFFTSASAPGVFALAFAEPSSNPPDDFSFLSSSTLGSSTLGSLLA